MSSFWRSAGETDTDYTVEMKRVWKPSEIIAAYNKIAAHYSKLIGGSGSVVSIGVTDRVRIIYIAHPDVIEAEFPFKHSGRD